MWQPYLSIVIPAFNEAETLAACLSSLQAQSHTRPFEIIVVDNASTDNTAAIAAAAGVTVVSEAAKGVCAARQAGFVAARGEVIVSTDADCTYPPGWLAGIERQFLDQPDVSCRVGTYRFVGARIPNLLLAAYEQLAQRLYFACGWKVYVSGANLAFRVSLFDGYDTNLASGGDEIFVVRQLQSRGRVSFKVGLPVLTSARRLQGRFWLTLFYDFGLRYLGGYFFGSGQRQAATNVRTLVHPQRRWLAMLAQIIGTILMISLVGVIIWLFTRFVTALPHQPLTWYGLAAVMAGGLAYCTFWPTSQLVMPALWRVKSPQKLVALTFDDGPNEPYTSQIAAIIESYGGKATFFQCGQMIKRSPGVTARLAAAGHTIGNHGSDHRFGSLWRPQQLLAGIRATTDAILRAGGQAPRFYRAPWLTKSPIIAWAVARAGLMPIAGTFISFREVVQPDGAAMARRCLARIQPGAIIILHDSRETHGGDRSQTVRAVEIMCQTLTRDGYQLVSLDEIG